MFDGAVNQATNEDGPPDPELEGLLCELVDDWNNGTPLSLRSYLGRRPGLRERPAAVVELISQEIILRLMRGDSPRPEDYLADYPELSQSVMRLFEVHALASSPCAEANTVAFAPPLETAKLLRGGAGRSVPSIPGYEIERVLGRGGMGIVYLALHRPMNRRVALKLLRETAEDDQAQIARFRREAEAAARCQHPNLVQIYDFGQHAGEFYIAMEYVPGGHLGRAMAGKPQPPPRAAELVETLSRAIDHAHAQGVIHRDLKPANILLAAGGEPKISDFGLAKLKDSSVQTEVGALLGTIAYMAPEQVGARGVDIGPRTDVHALGAILYELLTGRAAYRALTPQQLLHAIVTEDAPRPSSRQPGIARDLEAICLKCLEKRPIDRYPSAADLADDLRRFLDGEPVRARPLNPLGWLWRWCRRNPKLAFVSGSLLATVLIASVVVIGQTYRHNVQLRAEVKRTAARAAEARRNYQEARAAIEAMLARLDDRRLVGSPRLLELRRVQREDALGFYERILSHADSNDPAVGPDTAWALSQASVLQSGLGRDDLAEKTARRGIALIERARALKPDDADHMARHVEALARLSTYLLALNRLSEATAVGRDAVELSARLVQIAPDNANYQDWQAICHQDYGNALLQSGRKAEAREQTHRAVEIRQGMARFNRPSVTYLLAESLVAEGIASWHERDYAGAEERFRRAEAIFISLPPEKCDPWMNVAIELARIHVNWSGMSHLLQRYDEAIAHADRGLAHIKPYLHDEPNDAIARNLCLMLHGNRGHALSGLGRYRESLEEWRHVMTLSGEDVATECRVGLAVGLLGAGEVELAVAEAQKVKERRDVSAGKCYNLACIFARAAAARGNTQIPQDDRMRSSRSYSSNALGWLKAAAERGFFRDPANREHAKKDSDLEILRDRPEFREIIDSSPPKP
jgi:eukaryotic-like serine/threonine-protein kinase